MVTTGAKYFFGVTIFGFAAALVYGFGSRGGMLGVLTFGLRGGTGELAGIVVLLSVTTVALFLGLVVVAFRDADADAVAAYARTDEVPQVSPPASESYWPVVGAFAVGITLVGLVVGVGLVILGLAILVVTIFEWMVKAWADRATGDAEVNRSIRNRLMYPVEIPLIGALTIAVIVFSVSRLLLSVSEQAAVAVAGTFAVLILAGLFFIAYRPDINRSVVAALLLAGALAVLAGGIVGASVGERDFEKREEPAGGPAPGEGQEGSMPGPVTWHLQEA